MIILSLYDLHYIFSQLEQNGKKGSIQGSPEKIVFNNGTSPHSTAVDLPINPVDEDASWVDRFTERPIIAKVV